jgi:hypothetical protein
MFKLFFLLLPLPNLFKVVQWARPFYFSKRDVPGLGRKSSRAEMDKTPISTVP